MKRKIKKGTKVAFIITGSFLVFVMVLSSFVVFSPIPVIWIISEFVFAQPKNGSWNDRTSINGLNVTVSEELIYDSNAKANTLSTFNIIYPNNCTEELSVIFFAHGGGYISGDKEENENYMIRLANEGYVIFNMNYSLAPSFNYPSPLIQFGKFYKHIFENESKYESLFDIRINLDSLFLGGDSAGANLVSIFSLCNTTPGFIENSKFLNEHKNDILVSVFAPKGVILFCGVFDWVQFKKTSGFIRFVVDRIARGITGFWSWESSGMIEEMSLFFEGEEGLTTKLTSSFPAVYVTDGDDELSFTDQGETLAELLRNLGVSVTQRFYRGLTHEFQFMLGNVENDNKLNEDERSRVDNCIKAAKEVYDDVVHFLAEKNNSENNSYTNWGYACGAIS